MPSAYTYSPLTCYFSEQQCQYSLAKFQYYTWFCSSQLLKVNETSYQIRMAAFYVDVALKWLLFSLIIMLLEKVLWLRLCQTVRQHNCSCICFKQWQALPWSAGWYDSLEVHHPSDCTYKRTQIPEVRRPTSKGKSISMLPSSLPCTGLLKRLFKYTVGFQLAFQIREKAPYHEKTFTIRY